MTDTTISIRIDKNMHEKMKRIEYINWSAILRKALMQELSKIDEVNKEKVKIASETMNRIRKEGIFNKGKTGVEIIREWRNKRRF
mgnify:CR=1 FL=1